MKGEEWGPEKCLRHLGVKMGNRILQTGLGRKVQ